jgi:hypothetical protein
MCVHLISRWWALFLLLSNFDDTTKMPKIKQPNYEYFERPFPFYLKNSIKCAWCNKKHMENHMTKTISLQTSLGPDISVVWYHSVPIPKTSATGLLQEEGNSQQSSTARKTERQWVPGVQWHSVLYEQDCPAWGFRRPVTKALQVLYWRVSLRGMREWSCAQMPPSWDCPSLVCRATEKECWAQCALTTAQIQVSKCLFFSSQCGSTWFFKWIVGATKISQLCRKQFIKWKKTGYHTQIQTKYWLKHALSLETLLTHIN